MPYDLPRSALFARVEQVIDSCCEMHRYAVEKIGESQARNFYFHSAHFLVERLLPVLNPAGIPRRGYSKSNSRCGALRCTRRSTQNTNACRRQEVTLATRDGIAMIAVLEAHMQGREYVAGSALTVADFNAAYTLDWAREAGMLADAPRLQAYLDKMYARPKAPMTIAAGFAALQP